ncbi:MAG: ribosome biogenesis GTP-binding protein YihA/YsxC [Catalinimonas sp.]
MDIQEAQYVMSCEDVQQCPPPVKPEYAFIGRSNVGKSSLINLLTDRRHLARTSGQPGKTRMISHFLIDDAWYLVDLPGYGYAKVGIGTRTAWEEMIQNYLAYRANLLCTFVLLDVRHDPLDNDLTFISWLGERGIPFALVFTKADKLAAARVQQQVEAYEQKLLETWEELPPRFVTSSTSRLGREELLGFIRKVNRDFTPITE